MAARFHGVRHASDVSLTLGRVDQEMKYRAVMPHIKGLGQEGNLSDVAQQPADFLGSMPQPFLCRLDCGRRNVKNGERLVSTAEKVVRKRGFAGPYVDDRARSVGTVV